MNPSEGYISILFQLFCRLLIFYKSNFRGKNVEVAIPLEQKTPDSTHLRENGEEIYPGEIILKKRSIVRHLEFEKKPGGSAQWTHLFHRYPSTMGQVLCSALGWTYKNKTRENSNNKSKGGHINFHA